MAPNAAAGAFPCPRCGAAFARESHLALHGGRAHGGDLSEAERAAFAAARAEEAAWLARFQRHARAGLATLPVALTFLATALVVHLSGIGLGWMFLLLPGTAIFAVLVYALVFTREPTGEDGDAAEAGAVAGREWRN